MSELRCFDLELDGTIDVGVVISKLEKYGADVIQVDDEPDVLMVLDITEGELLTVPGIKIYKEISRG